MKPQMTLRAIAARTRPALIAAPVLVGGLAAGEAVAQAPVKATDQPAAAAKAPARLTADRRELGVLVGEPAEVAGRLHPARPGRLVALERQVEGRWKTLDTDRTARDGSYQVRHEARETGGGAVRVSFSGDRQNGPVSADLGRMTAYRSTRASYYALYGGALACGGRLGYDSLVVAHRSLPCGTRVTVRYQGRIVHARVRDRGPFVGGREFDLAGAVARRVGFQGVGTIWVSH